MTEETPGATAPARDSWCSVVRAAVLGITLAPHLLAVVFYALGMVLTQAFNPLGAFLAITIGYSTLALLSVVLFRRGRWKLRAL